MVLTDRKICSKQLAMGPTNVPFLEQFKTHDVSLWLIFFACCLVAWPIKTIFMQNFTLFLFTYFRGEGEVDNKSFFC